MPTPQLQPGFGGQVEQQDVERIARKALKELGVTPTALTVVSAGADAWRIEFGGEQSIKIRCGRGSSAQWVREQIFEQVLAR